MRQTLQRLWSVVRAPAAIALIAVAFAFSASTVARGHFAMGDFKAFYCSARVLLQHEDPYAAAPMAACQAQPAPAPLLVTKPGEVLPAPLPGYVIAAFVPLAWLPFAVASALWFALLVVATIASIVLLSRIGIGDPWSIALALAMIVAGISFPVGELPPIAFLGIALAAWAAKRGRPWLLGVGVVLSFCEPQIGLGAALAAIALGRRYAIPAIAAAVALGILSFSALGIAGNVEYFRLILPAHLLSELPSVLQYSLSWALYRLGMAAAPALLFGRLSWLVMLGVTIWFARSSLARQRPEVALLAAPAFAVVGGPFLHLDHAALAVPAALWLASEKYSWLRTAAAIALCLPLLYIFSITRSLVLIPFFAAWLASVYKGGAIAGLRAALAAVVLTALVAIASIAAGTGLHAIAPVQALPPSIAQASWSQYVAAHYVMTGWVLWLVKAPTWFGILATAVGLAASALRPPREALA